MAEYRSYEDRTKKSYRGVGPMNANEIEVVELNLESDGYYEPMLKIIFINKNLTEAKKQEVVKAIKTVNQ